MLSWIDKAQRRALSSRELLMLFRHWACLSLAAGAVLVAPAVRADDVAQSANGGALSAGREQQLIEEGHRFADGGDFCEAWRRYDEAAQLQDEPPSALLFAIGRAAHKAGVWDHAVVALERFLRASDDENANNLARKWLAEAEAGVARCPMTVDASAPVVIELEGEAVPPAGGASSCDHREVVRTDQGHTALLNIGWRYELRGHTAGKLLRPLQVHVLARASSAAPIAPGAGSDTEISADACVLSFASELASSQPSSDIPPIAQPRAAAGALQRLPRPERSDQERGHGGIPSLSYVAWGGAALATAGMSVALVEHANEVEQWNSDDCLKAGLTREQNCGSHQARYRSASTWALGTGIAAAALGATGAIIWWLGSNGDETASAWSCSPGPGASALCTTRF